MSASILSPSEKYEDMCQGTQIIMIRNFSRDSLVSESNKAYLKNAGCQTYDEEEKEDDDGDECCPICYEDYTVYPSSTSYPIEIDEESRAVTKSTHEEIFDYDSDESRVDLKAFDTNTKFEIDIDSDQLEPYLSVNTLSGKGNFDDSKSKQKGQTCLKGLHNTSSHPREQHRRSCCDPSEKVVISECGHDFCRGCLKEHCSYAISIRDLPIRCPKYSGDDSSAPCSGVLSTEIIRESLLMEDPTNPEWTKFQRLQRMLEDSSLISCTRCDELISPKDQVSNSSSNDPNRIECPSCQHVFCRVHGDGHLNSDCFEASQHADKEDPSEMAIHELCKPCSHCRVPIFKEEGCNHVVCPVCKDDMCFNCGTHEHLESKGKTVRVCKNCNGSYFDHRYVWLERLKILATLPFMIPIYVGYMAMTLALAIASCGCFCCLGCGVRFKEPKKTKQNPKSKTIVFMPVMAVREVLGWLLMPFIDLFQSCRIPCCFCHNAPGLCRGRPADDDDDDDYDDEESYCVTSVEANSMENDVENQLGEP